MAVPLRSWAIVPDPVTGIIRSSILTGTAPFSWGTGYSTSYGEYIIGQTISIKFADSALLVPVSGVTYAIQNGLGVPLVMGHGTTFNTATGELSGTLTGAAFSQGLQIIATHNGIDYPGKLSSITAVADNSGITVPFPYWDLSYISLVAKFGGKGMESSAGYGRHAGNTAASGTNVAKTRRYWVTSLGNANTGTWDAASNTGMGTFRWCMRHKVTGTNVPNSKYVGFLVSGVVDCSTGCAFQEDNCIVDGASAPDPGVWFTGGVIGMRGFNNCTFKHIGIIVGDDMVAGSPASNSRDGFNFGSANRDAALTVNQNFIHCEVVAAHDEICEAYYAGDRVNFHRCLFGPPLAFTYHLTDGKVTTRYSGGPPLVGTPPDTYAREQHPAGPLLGGTGDGTYEHIRQFNFANFTQCAFVDCAIRNPKLYVKLFYLGNCVFYNFGKASSNDNVYVPNSSVTGGAIDIASCDVSAALSRVSPVQGNVENCLFLRGANQNNTRRFIGGGDVYKAGSQVHVAGCVQKGWSGVNSQEDFVTDQWPSNMVSSTVIAQARPGGVGNNFEKLRTIASNLYSPSTNDLTDFITEIGNVLGVRPGRRSGGLSLVPRIITRMLSSAAGTHTGGIPNSMFSTRNPLEWNNANLPVGPALFPEFTSVAQWKASVANNSTTLGSLGVPLANAGGDNILSSGTLSDGVTSAVGMTAFEKWSKDRHYYVMGNRH